MKKFETIYVENNQDNTKIALHACDLLSIIKKDTIFDLGNNRKLLFDKTTNDIVFFDNDGSEIYLEEVVFSAD